MTDDSCIRTKVGQLPLTPTCLDCMINSQLPVPQKLAAVLEICSLPLPAGVLSHLMADVALYTAPRQTLPCQTCHSSHWIHQARHDCCSWVAGCAETAWPADKTRGADLCQHPIKRP